MLESLVDRANALPIPHRAEAAHNVADALEDLTRWPEHETQILSDLEQAIEAHEVLAAETQSS